MMSPLIRQLHRTYPACEISIISVNKIADYLIYDPHIRHVLKAKHPRPEVKAILNRLDFDLLFNTKDHPSVTFLYLSGRICARYKVGMDDPQHRGFFDHLLIPPPDSSMVRTYLSLLDYLKISYTAKDFRPYLPAGPITEEIAKFSKTLYRESVVAVNLSASQTYKEWPQQKWIDFLSRIKHPVMVLAMPDKTEEKKALEIRFPHVIPSPPTATIFDAGHLIRHSRALISQDTALVHLASCFDTPVVALYRQPLDLQKFPPFSKNQQVLMSKDGQIGSIPVSAVTDAFHRLLSSQ